jgi:hypothetical protein
MKKWNLLNDAKRFRVGSFTNVTQEAWIMNGFVKNAERVL